MYSSLILSLISFIIIIVSVVQFTNHYKKTNNNNNKYELFTYDFKDLCISQFEKITDKECPASLYHGNFHMLIDWDKLNSHQFATLYQLSSTQNSLTTENFWLSIFDSKIKLTIGGCRWTMMYIEASKKTIGKSTVSFKKARISSASGILNQYQNQLVLIDYRDQIRKIYLFTNQTKLSVLDTIDYKKWLKKKSKLT